MMVQGLSEPEQQVMSGLLKQLDEKRVRNDLRRAHMDCKKLPKPPPTVPPYLREMALVLGWPAKAVEALARRVRLNGFAVPGAELSAFGLDEILDDNEYVAESRMAQLSALEMGVSWLVASTGAAGEPDVVITRQTALDGTGLWDIRARRLTSFLSVNERGGDGHPASFNLFLPGETVAVAGRRVEDRIATGLEHVPVEPLVYRQRDGRPFGSSRITRPIMQITHSAVRTMLRSEGTADFYGTPLLALFGPDERLFQQSPPLKMLLSSMFAVPDNPDADNPRADLKQLTQGSQAPHVTQLEVWAQLFAGEAKIPVSSLGIGAVQANPTSAESYLASREELVSEAEDTQDGFSRAHTRILQSAWRLREGGERLPAELRGLAPVWRDARHESKASAADWLTKVVSAVPWIADTDEVLELMGVDEGMAARLRASRRRQRSVSMIGELAQSVPVVDDGMDGADLKSRFDALGIAIRSGVDPADAAARVGLSGVKFTGATPVSLRLPESDAAQLEEK